MQNVKQLLKDGVNPNFRDYSGATPLHKACSAKFTSAVKLLIENGADVNAQNNSKNTPLIFTMASIGYRFTKDSNVKTIISLLLNAGADLSIKNNLGQDPIMLNKFDKKVEEFIEEQFPEKYAEYLMKKDADKYNL